ncbi:MAG: hypothetical protein ACO1O6_04865 [Bacteroidota bacterium]
MSAYDNLIRQVDAFIRKYYKNEMLKGLLFFIGFSLFSFLTVITLEYFGRFSGGIRAGLFYAFIGIFTFLTARYLVFPVSKLFSLGKLINRYQAAEIIGSFFPEISDRLLNTLQLNDSLFNNDANFELIRASVQQRSKTISAIPFVNGIDFRKNAVYLKYVLPVVLVFVLIGLFFPTLISQGTKRVVNYDREFKPEAPFNFILTSDLVPIQEGEDFPVELKFSGSEIPDKVYLHSANGKFLMNKQSKISSFFVLKRLKESSSFYFEANGFESKRFQIRVIPKTAIGKFQATLDYPEYLGKKDEVISNAGDLEIPEGTKVTWSVASKNAGKTILKWSDESKTFTTEGFSYGRKFFASTPMKVLLVNKNESFKDSLIYGINVVQDQYPQIEVQEEKDSISDALRFFSGQISDDYGLSSLTFVYTITSKNGKKEERRVSVTNPGGSSMPFRHAVDFRREKLAVDDKIEYYFVVRDNDGVHGPKAMKSRTFTYELPSLDELNEKRDEANADAQKDLNKLIKRSEEFKKDVDKLKKDVLNSKSSDWNQQNQMQQLKEERNALQNEIEELQMKMSESLMEKNQLSEMDEELLEKQELLQELLEEVMDDELRDLLNKLEELMQKQDKNALEKNLEQLDMKSEDMNKQLDRSLEMLKRMQVNEKIDDATKELKELAKEQEALKEQLEKNQVSTENAEKKQDEINKKFDEIKQDLDELKKLNEDLKKPMELGDQEELKKEISEEQKEAKENLNQSKEKKAAQNQEKSAKKMEQMANEMEQMQQQANQKQDQEDMNALRNILESLMTLSFNQEDVLTDFSKVKDKDPMYKRLGKAQRRIIDDTRIVEDSLNAIAMRQPKIASFITKELNDINSNFNYGLENIDEHRRKELLTNLQFVMTGYNNLALMLNESLQQMQQQMQQSNSSGSGSCNNPGGKGKKPSDGESSEDMKEMLKKQLEKMQKGPNPGGTQPGDKEGQGQNMMGLGNKEIAKMAAQQTAIRQRLEQMRNELNKEGQGKGNQLNPLINELEKQERDLINKNFSKEMIKRQKDILTRLLESEKALMERGFEEKRESKVGKNVFLSNQKRIDEYNNQKLKQIELLRSVDPVFKKYYKDKANEYFNSVN